MLGFGTSKRSSKRCDILTYASSFARGEVKLEIPDIGRQSTNFFVFVYIFPAESPNFFVQIRHFRAKCFAKKLPPSAFDEPTAAGQTQCWLLWNAHVEDQSTAPRATGGGLFGGSVVWEMSGWLVVWLVDYDLPF